MSERYWKLNKDLQPVRCTIKEWGNQRVGYENNIVDQTAVGDFWISTVFLGLDHNFSGSGLPHLWETLVVKDGNYTDAELERCGGDWWDATLMHLKMVKKVRDSQ